MTLGTRGRYSFGPIIEHPDGEVELGGTAKITTTSGNLTILPTSGITVIGDAGSTSHTLTANDDLFLSGKLEVNGASYFDASVLVYSALSIQDDVEMQVGAIGDSRLDWSTAQATAHTTIWGLGSTSKSVIFCNNADRNQDFDHAAQSNPTIFVHSNTDPDTANDEWISISHNVTDGVIDCGSGTLNLGGTANVNFAGATRTASTVTHNAYVTLEVGGTEYKFMLGA